MTPEVADAIYALQGARVKLEALRMVVIGQTARDALENVIRVVDHVLGVVIPAMVDEGKGDRIPAMVARQLEALRDVVDIQWSNTPVGAVTEILTGIAIDLGEATRRTASFVERITPWAIGAGIVWGIDRILSKRRK